MTQKELGIYFKNVRKEGGLTQVQVSKKLGHATCQYISNVERGACVPSAKYVKVLCRIARHSLFDTIEMCIKTYEYKLKESIKYA